jgi:RNA polymerase sigma factor (TIGR02999 family)
MDSMDEISRILEQARRGDENAVRDLLPLVYDELRRLAERKLGREPAGQTLQATALVHEVYLRLSGDDVFENRKYFFSAAATAMRRILVERARRKRRPVHGGDRRREELQDELLAVPERDDRLVELDAALSRLAEKDPIKAQLVELKCFAGLTGDQAAETLGISPSAADRHWAFARAWLRREVKGEQFDQDL